jgi:hypothetical protein
LTSYGKVNIVAIDTFGLISEDFSDNYFNLILGYSKLAFAPDTCNFGPVPVNAVNDISQSVWIKNLGNKDLTLNNLNGLDEPFSFVFSAPLTILPGDSVELEITLDRNFPAAIYTDAIVFDTTSKGNNTLPVVATLYNSLPNVSLGNDITKCGVSTITITATTSGGVPPYSYNWNTGSANPIISTSTPIDSTFIVTITDQLGLQDSDTINVIIQQVYQGEEICIVTVDSASQKNIIIWEKTGKKGTAYYNVYKLPDTINPIGIVPFESLSLYIDTVSNPNQQAYRYCITAKDSCGNESYNSMIHKSIHLQTNQGFPSGVNLSWNVYEGFNYIYFNIYRVLLNGSTSFLGQVEKSGIGTHTFTDLNPSPLVYTYRVTVEKDFPCNPDTLLIKSASGPFKQSLSNIGDNYYINYEFHFKVFLEGLISGPDQMNGLLFQNDLIPLTQPFNNPPWNYLGEESVQEIPNSDILDWILLELRSTAGYADSATSDKRLFRRAGFLKKTGIIVDLDGESNISIEGIFPNEEFNLYTIIIPRNYLSIMSESALSSNNNVYSFDFTSHIGYFKPIFPFQLPQKYLNGKWVMISGDADANGMIDVNDKSDSLWKQVAGNKGYYNFDLNYDGQLNNIDKNSYWKPNLGMGSQVPQ